MKTKQTTMRIHRKKLNGGVIKKIAKIRESLHEMVSLEHGLYRLNDQGASIRNVKLRKDRIIYDVVLFDYSDNSSSRHNGVETSFEELESFQKEQQVK
jgi:tRNA pseudouridine-54 N-methylase